MLFFLYGQDSYRVKEKIDEIVSEYHKKYSSGLSLARLDMSNEDVLAVRENVSVVSMFSEKKLIILSNVFGDKTKEKELLEYLADKNINEDEDVILIIRHDSSQKVNARNAFLLFLLKSGKSQEFKLLTLPKLREWIIAHLRQDKLKISDGAIQMIMDFVGNDLWQISQELSKLSSFVLQDKKDIIDENDIKCLVMPKVDSNIFTTIDCLGNKDRKRTLELLRAHFQTGENELYILSMFVYQFRNITQVKDLLDAGVAERDIASQTKISPYVVQKSIASARLFSLEDLKNIYQMLLQVDLGIKTGRFEPKTALDLLVMEITK